MDQTLDNRKPRSLEQRETTERPKTWKPAQLLTHPNPEPGYAFRWVRTRIGNQDDSRNIAAALSEGWEPVKASDHPEIHTFGENNTRFPDSVSTGGLMLCKTPAEFVEQRNAHYGKQADTQMQSLDNSYMRESNPMMPLYTERKSTVTFGKGN